MHREFYTRLISREHPLPEAFVPEHLIDIGLPFEAAPGDPKRLLEYQAAKAASQLFHACQQAEAHKQAETRQQCAFILIHRYAAPLFR